MKKLILGTIAAATLAMGTSTIAIAQMKDAGPNETVIKLFAKSQDMTEYQQTLAVELFHQVKSLITTVKSPEQDLKTYVHGLIEQDSIDVNEVMEKYKAWQQKVDKEFEQSVIAVAKLHSDLSIEQREKLISTIKQMRGKKIAMAN